MDNQDFYFENNCIVLTESFLKKRGFCCKNNCRHCPYKGSNELKTKYILKTNNDLQFDFNQHDRIKLVGSPYDIHGDWIGSLEAMELPYKVEIEDHEYTIISFIKIHEV